MRKIASWFYKKPFLLVFVFSCIITSIFFYDVVFQKKTLLSPGLTSGVMGSNGPYGFTPTIPDVWPKYASFIKDLGSNAWAGEPQVSKVAQVLRQFTFPLWNDNVQLGKPLAANFLSSAFYPLKIILYLFPSASGWDFYLLSRLAIGVFFTALFLREIKVKFFPALIGGVLFSFSGFFILYHNIQDIDTEVIVPLLFWAIAYVITLGTSANKIKPYQYIIAILALVSVLLSNIPEPLILLLASGFVYWLYRLVALYIGNKNLFKPAIKFSLMVVLPTLLIVLPLYLVNYEFTTLAFTLHTKDAKIGSTIWTQFKFWIMSVFPYMNSPQFLLPLIPAKVIDNYFGLVGFFLALFGTLSALIERKTRLFILIFTLVVSAKIFGIEPINSLIGHLPGFDRVLYIKYAESLLSFGIACLAAFGLSDLIERKITWKKFTLVSTSFVFLIYQGIKKLPDIQFTLNNLHILFGLGAILIALCGITVLLNQSKTKIRLAPIVLLAFALVAELFLLVPRLYRPARYETFTKPPFVAYLQSQAKPYRIFAFDRLLYPEISSAFNIDDVRDLDGLFIKQYPAYIKNFISPGIYDRFTGAAEGSNEVKPVSYANNPWFDLLNVKYLLAKTPPLELFPENNINQEIFKANEITPVLRETTFFQNNDARRVLLEAAPSKACARLDVAPNKDILKFSTAIDKTAWNYPDSDGVIFKIEEEGGKSLFDFTQNPTGNPNDKQWIDHEVDLSDFVGTSPNLCFITDPRSNSLADVSGWTDLRLTTKEDTSTIAPNEQYRLIYDDEIVIYENKNVYPRGFLTGSVENVNGDDSAIAKMKEANFNPKQKAVVTDSSKQPAGPELSGDKCQNSLTDYQRPNPNYFKFKINSPGNCFLIYSESYYPGWIAKVDDKKVPIYQTDLMFRGLYLDPGDHNVEFIYRPLTFYGGLIGTLVGILLMVYWSKKNNKISG